MYDTPFDNIAIKLSETSRSLRGTYDQKLVLCQTFAQVCRIKYLQMRSASEKSWLWHGEMKKQPAGTRSISTKEHIDHSLELMEVKTNYFGFIEELNRFGRVFEEKYAAVIPDYFRIRFYRNKIIEHWDRYEEYLNVMGNGYMFQQEKLIVPSHFGAINMPPRGEEVYQELNNEFKKIGVDLPTINLEMTVDNAYSQAIFANLEKASLRIENVPKSLVNALFKYSFPVPIHNIEDYIVELLLWLEEFTKEYQII